MRVGIELAYLKGAQQQLLMWCHDFSQIHQLS